MKTTIEIIQADSVNGYNPYVSMSWTDPDTGESQTVTGELRIKNEQYCHVIPDKNGSPLYEVRGSNE